jgi:SAM-dependent methyltransferase
MRGRDGGVMDDSKLQEFMGKLLTDMSGAAMMASVILGEEVGFYRAMKDGTPVSPDELAAKVGCNARLTQEWLNAQAAAGYLEYAGGRYRLPAEQAMALADENSPFYVASGVSVLASLFHDKEKLVAAMRGNGALSWADHHPCLFSGTERFFRPGYQSNLTSSWLPALDGVVAKLQNGVKVADIGCGHGASTVIMARAYPASQFFGFDFHGPSINVARDRAREAGVAERTTFMHADARSYNEKDFDLICFFDCLHDMGDPVGVAMHACQALKADGTVLLVEPFAHDELERNMNPIGRMFYAASTFVCTPNALSQDGGMALGAQAGEGRLKDVFLKAGFTRFHRATETPFNLILEARK